MAVASSIMLENAQHTVERLVHYMSVSFVMHNYIPGIFLNYKIPPSLHALAGRLLCYLECACVLALDNSPQLPPPAAQGSAR